MSQPKDHARVAELRQQINEHNFRYHIRSSPIITDAEYDTLFKELCGLEAQYPELADPNSPTSRVGCPVPTAFATVKHKTRMLSLKNAFSVADVLQYFGQGLFNEQVAVEMKIDGLSLHLSYKKGQLVQAVTRGDGTAGEDVTSNARAIPSVPLVLKEPVDIEVRGEVYMRWTDFYALNKALEDEGDEKMANPRNAAGGALRLKNSTEVHKRRLSFIAYAVPTDLPASVRSQDAVLEYLEELGFLSTLTIPLQENGLNEFVHIVPLNAPQLTEAINELEALRKTLNLETDGLVLKILDIARQRDMGEGNHHPNWALAYKFAPERKVTKLLSVTVQIGKSGKLTPVAQLEPVELGGAVVQRASLCNQDELRRLGIDVGDFVFVERSAEVIPKVMGLSRPSPTKAVLDAYYRMPKRCPCCNTELVQPPGMVDIYCPNKACHDQVFARLVHATSKAALDIDGCGESTVSLLIKSGVHTLSDLFALQDFSMLKTHAAKKLHDGLEKAKSAPLWRKLCAFSIEGLGRTTAQDLAAKYPGIGEMYADPALEELVGERAAKNLREFMVSSIDEIERLADLGFVLAQDVKTMGPLSGKTFVITGTLMTGRRDDIAALIENQGGTIKGAVTKKVDFLLQGVGGGANKASAAKKHGTRILSEEQLYEMLGIEMPAPTAGNTHPEMD